MRILIFLLLIIIFTACDHPKKPHIEELTWPKRTVKLDNGLGVLTIRLPDEFDTFYQWIDKSEVDTCYTDFKYRIQNSTFPIIKENGRSYYKYIDSIYAITISHSCDESCQIKDIEMYEYMKQELLKRNKDRINELEKEFKHTYIDSINQLETIITPFESGILYPPLYKIKVRPKILICRIRNKNSIINIEFECAASNCDSFIPKMYKALQTVEIKP